MIFRRLAVWEAASSSLDPRLNISISGAPPLAVILGCSEAVDTSNAVRR